MQCSFHEGSVECIEGWLATSVQPGWGTAPNYAHPFYKYETG